jgi:hypothetical protein
MKRGTMTQSTTAWCMHYQAAENGRFFIAAVILFLLACKRLLPESKGNQKSDHARFLLADDEIV